MPNYFDQIQVADAREVKAEEVLEKAKLSDGVHLLAEDPLRVELVAQDWHFGVVIPLRAPLVTTPDGMFIARARVYVPNGNVRLGCVNESMDTYVSNEVEVFGKAETQVVEVEVPADAAFIVFRTGITTESLSPQLELCELRIFCGKRPVPKAVADVFRGDIQRCVPSGSTESKAALESLTIELLVTHSTRAFDAARGSADFIRNRYSGHERFAKAPPFESLPSSSTQHYLHGAVSHFSLAISNAEVTLRPLRCLDSLELIEHAAIVDGKFVVCCNGFLCVLPSLEYPIAGNEFDVSSPFRIDDPWFSGLHSVIPTGKPNECLVSASGPDAVLWVDLLQRKVTRRLRLPENIYGLNYPLTEETSVHDHYIPNDFQLGHLNSAFPDGDRGCYLSTLGQGDVGHFDRDGNYSLLASGYIGAHGVRRSLDGGFVYFTESPAGRVNKIAPDGSVEMIVQIDTAWLHDAQQITDELFVCLPVDRNELLLVDVVSKCEVARFDMSSRGLNPQFVSIVQLSC